MAIVVCAILAFVVLLQIRHWHGRAIDSLRQEERRNAWERSMAEEDGRRADGTEWEWEEWEEEAEERRARRRRAA